MMNDHGAKTEPTAETTILADDESHRARFPFGKPFAKVWYKRGVGGAKEQAHMVLRMDREEGVSELSYYVEDRLVRQLDLYEATLDDAQRTQFDKCIGGPLPTLMARDQPGWQTRTDLASVAQVAALPYDPRPVFLRARHNNELEVFYYDNATTRVQRWGVFVDSEVEPATFQAWNTTLPSPPGYTRCSIGVSRWGIDDPDYRPQTYTAGIVRANEGVWADKDTLSPKEIAARVSYAIFDGGNLHSMQSYPHRDDASGRWLCPFGRTGMAGRGVLGRWGPNHAADPIITRTVARGAMETPVVQVLLITRNDETQQLAFPGGMVDAGEVVRETLKRELCEEALSGNEAVHRLFSEGERGVVYCGPVMDWRTTDHAWIETTAVHFHATGDVAEGLELIDITDTHEVSKVAWYDIDTLDAAAMFASHGEWLGKVRDSFDAPVVTTKSSSQAPPFETHSAPSSHSEYATSKKRAAPDEMNAEDDRAEAKCDKRHCAQQIVKMNDHKEASAPSTEQLCADLNRALMQFSPKAIGVDLDFRDKLCDLLARTLVRVGNVTYRRDMVHSECSRLLMDALNADGVPESSTALANRD